MARKFSSITAFMRIVNENKFVNAYFIYQLIVIYGRASCILKSKHLPVLVLRAINNYLDRTVAAR